MRTGATPPEGADRSAAAAEYGRATLRAQQCTACSLHRNRTRCVYGVGDWNARLMWVGEAPGPDEDRDGEPFTGRSGQLLTRIIHAMGLGRHEVYLTNVALCRLDDDRTLTRSQVEACRPHLERQIELVGPEVIVPLGSTAWRWFKAGDTRKMADIRGQVYRWRGILLAPTYHPAFLLRRPEYKSQVWEDVRRTKLLLQGRIPDGVEELGASEQSLFG